MSCWPWMNRKYVRIGVCLTEFEADVCVRGRCPTLMCCTNTLKWRWRLCVGVLWMHERCRVAPGQPGGAFVLVCAFNSNLLFVFDVVWGRNLTVMCCPNTLLWRWWRLCVYVRRMYVTGVSCWSWTNRKCVRIVVWAKLKVLFVFDAVWGRDISLMWFQWHYNGDGRCAFTYTDKQLVRLCWCVFGCLNL